MRIQLKCFDASMLAGKTFLVYGFGEANNRDEAQRSRD